MTGLHKIENMMYSYVILNNSTADRRTNPGKGKQFAVPVRARKFKQQTYRRVEIPPRKIPLNFKMSPGFKMVAG